jgi:hypothetical protein
MITWEVVVLAVRHAEEVGKYAVEMTIDGVNQVFVFGISPRSDTSVTFETSFERTFHGVLGARRIAGFVTSFHKGQPLAVPAAFQVFILERGDKPPSLR